MAAMSFVFTVVMVLIQTCHCAYILVSSDEPNPASARNEAVVDYTTTIATAAAAAAQVAGGDVVSVAASYADDDFTTTDGEVRTVVAVDKERAEDDSRRRATNDTIELVGQNGGAGVGDRGGAVVGHDENMGNVTFGEDRDVIWVAESNASFEDVGKRVDNNDLKELGKEVEEKKRVDDDDDKGDGGGDDVETARQNEETVGEHVVDRNEKYKVYASFYDEFFGISEDDREEEMARENAGRKEVKDKRKDDEREVNVLRKETVDQMIAELSDFLDKYNPCILSKKREQDALNANVTYDFLERSVVGIVDDAQVRDSGVRVTGERGGKILIAETLKEMETKMNTAFDFCAETCCSVGQNVDYKGNSSNSTKNSDYNSTTNNNIISKSNNNTDNKINSTHDNIQGRQPQKKPDESNCKGGNRGNDYKKNEDKDNDAGDDDYCNNKHYNPNCPNADHRRSCQHQNHCQRQQQPKQQQHSSGHRNNWGGSGDGASQSSCIDVFSQESVISQLCTKMASLESGNRCITSTLLANHRKAQDDVSELEREIVDLKRTVEFLQRSAMFYAEAPFGSSQVRGYKVKVIQGEGFEPVSGYFIAPYDGAYQITVGYFRRATSNIDDLINVMLDNKTIFRLHVDRNDEQRTFMTSLETGQSLSLKTNTDYSNEATDGLDPDLVQFGVVLVK